ncbi:MAG: phosphotransferase family protein [Candidatus Dormibacter sp.]|uniref:phosphotransferase family protein n=1 Tax=Candidatus Dormibacter sp. TaxID=2973982 RepID=UPI0026D86E57
MPDLSRERVAEIRSLVEANLHGYPVHSAAALGQGQDNTAYEVNGELVLRFSREPDPARRAQRVEREARLLALAAEISPLPVPKPLFTAAERGCLGYLKLLGVPLLDLPLSRRLVHSKVSAAALGELLTALHAIPVDRLTDLAGTDDDPPAQWLSEAVESYALVAGEVPALHRPSVEAFLDTRPRADSYAPAFSHNDLGIEHVLVDPVSGRVTGIIDWGDAAIIDPAYDFGLLYRDLGPTGLDAALRTYRSDVNPLPALAERAAFYARCSVLEDLAYGIEKGEEKYIENSLTALGWLFPA